MKTLNLSRLIFTFLLFSLISGTTFAQKSVNYESVGSNLDEINTFVEQTFASIDKASTEVIDELEAIIENRNSEELIQKVTDWSEIHLNEFTEAAREARIWLSKQHFAPVKKACKTERDLAEIE